MRDHRKLEVFWLADELALEVYRTTQHFPREELFGLTSQLRRAAVSVSSNLVEGCSRSSHKAFLHFVEIAYGSAREVSYQLSLANRLGYLKQRQGITQTSDRTCKALYAFLRKHRKVLDT